MGRSKFWGSDHAPHCDYEKEVEFDYAPFGITGLETELALSLMQLLSALLNGWDLRRSSGKFTTAPAALLRMNKGTLKPGADAGHPPSWIPDRQWVFDPQTSASKSYNNPFLRVAVAPEGNYLDDSRRQNGLARK